MEGLSFDNVMSTDEILSLFDETDSPAEETKDTDINDDITEEIIEDPFADDLESPESVGDEENNEGSKVQTPKKSSSSPNNFSSIASTLKELGTFENLTDEDIANIKDAQSLIDAIDQQVRSTLDDRQKRIDNALSSGVEPSLVHQYETVISNLESITDETLHNEDDNAVQLRKNLIYQDFLNRGYSKERAEKEVNKSFTAGTDIEDAIDALESNKQFYIDSYNKLVKENNDKIDAAKKEMEAQATLLKTSILEDKNSFKDLNVDNVTRRKIYDNITKPIYKDPTTKKSYTAIQKYALDNPADFQKYLGLVYTLTNGFKDFQGLGKSTAKKTVQNKIKELEHTISKSTVTGGNPNFFGGFSDPDESFPSWSIDI